MRDASAAALTERPGEASQSHEASEREDDDLTYNHTRVQQSSPGRGGDDSRHVQRATPDEAQVLSGERKAPSTGTTDRSLNYSMVDMERLDQGGDWKFNCSYTEAVSQERLDVEGGTETNVSDGGQKRTDLHDSFYTDSPALTKLTLKTGRYSNDQPPSNTLQPAHLSTKQLYASDPSTAAGDNKDPSRANGTTTASSGSNIVEIVNHFRKTQSNPNAPPLPASPPRRNRNPSYQRALRPDESVLAPLEGAEESIAEEDVETTGSVAEAPTNSHVQFTDSPESSRSTLKANEESTSILSMRSNTSHGESVKRSEGDTKFPQHNIRSLRQVVRGTSAVAGDQDRASPDSDKSHSSNSSSSKTPEMERSRTTREAAINSDLKRRAENQQLEPHLRDQKKMRTPEKHPRALTGGSSVTLHKLTSGYRASSGDFFSLSVEDSPHKQTTSEKEREEQDSKLESNQNRGPSDRLSTQSDSVVMLSGKEQKLKSCLKPGSVIQEPMPVPAPRKKRLKKKLSTQEKVSMSPSKSEAYNVQSSDDGGVELLSFSLGGAARVSSDSSPEGRASGARAPRTSAAATATNRPVSSPELRSPSDSKNKKPSSPNGQTQKKSSSSKGNPLLSRLFRKSSKSWSPQTVSLPGPRDSDTSVIVEDDYAHHPAAQHVADRSVVSHNIVLDGSLSFLKSSVDSEPTSGYYPETTVTEDNTSVFLNSDTFDSKGPNPNLDVAILQTPATPLTPVIPAAPPTPEVSVMSESEPPNEEGRPGPDITHSKVSDVPLRRSANRKTCRPDSGFWNRINATASSAFWSLDKEQRRFKVLW